MQRIYRQLLLFTSTVVFMALAPLIIFYAMGYRISSVDGNLPAVGVLLIDSVPRRAAVTIDGQDVGSTPKSISNLKPGTVTVEVTRSGFQSWRKQVTIEPAAVTELRGIRLFTATPEPEVLLDAVSAFSVSASRRLLAAQAGALLHILDQNGEEIIAPLPINFVVEELLWSPDNNYVLVQADNRAVLVDITAGRHETVSLLSRASEIVWDPRVPGRLLFLTPAGNLEAYHVTTRRLQTLAGGVATFATSSRHIVTVDREQEAITIRNLQGQPQNTIDLPEEVKSLLVTPGGELAVFTAAGGLQVVDQSFSETRFLPVADHVTDAGFSPSGQLLYVQTDDASLYVFNISDERLRHVPLKTLQLVVRLSRPIRDPQWFAGGQHLMYQVDDEIIITEIDTRDYPVSQTIDSTNVGASYPAVGEEGADLYYLKNLTGTTNLVKAVISPEQ